MMPSGAVPRVQLIGACEYGSECAFVLCVAYCKCLCVLRRILRTLPAGFKLGKAASAIGSDGECIVLTSTQAEENEKSQKRICLQT